ncbi:LPXTG-site transpeptidase family protein [Bacillus cereus]|nr:LPXTG-site transpeptidase family protein [Bacillus cereus]
MKLLNYIGMILMAIGLFMGSYYAVEWYKGKSSAQELTNEEIKSFKNIQHNQLPYETPVTSQVPSSQTEHKKGEKVAMLHIPKLKKKFSIYWGSG